MPTGLSIPVGVTNSGGAKLLSGENNDRKIIFLALGSDDNENAFQQQIGLGVDMVFGVNDPQQRGPILARIRRIFRVFEAQKRYKLVENSLKWTEDSKEQEKILFFKYMNLESDEVYEFSKTISQTAPEYI